MVSFRCARFIWVLGLTPVLLTPVVGGSAESAWAPPAVVLPEGVRHPVIACTPVERERLRQAWAGRGPTHDAVAAVVRRADRALSQAVDFPPRGGQHNQWYQCEQCQVPLETVNPTSHRCPQCKTVYSGAPYDDVLYSARHQQILQTMLDAAWAGTLTDDPRYVEFAKAVLLGYAERYRRYPYHANTEWNLLYRWVSGGRLFEQTLNEAVAMSTRIAPAYDLIHDSGTVSAEEHQRIRQGLILPMLENIDKYKAGINNWQSWHNAALFTGGAVLGDAGWMRKAVLGGNDSAVDQFISQAANLEAKGLGKAGNSFLFQMEHSVGADGMWYESSWGYHFYALQALVILAEAARRTGIDLWHAPRFLSMFTLPARTTLPDGTLPRFGDDVSSSARGHADLFVPAYAASGAGELLALLPTTPTWETVLAGREVVTPGGPPTLESAVFPGAGHAILRTGGPAGLTTAFTFGPYGGFHGHLDKLSFVFFGYGEELGVDPGRARSQAYRLPVHKRWYKGTIAHNTVLVDGAPQAGVAARLTLFGAGAALATAAAECDQAYPGVLHRRALLQTGGYLLVVDDLTADKVRRFDWLYHNRGDAAVCPAASADGNVEKRLEGGEYFRHVRQGHCDGPLSVSFPGRRLTVHLAMAASPDTTLITGDGVGASMTERVPLAMVTREGRRALFAATLEPVLAGATPQVREVKVSAAAAGLDVGVVGAGGADAFGIVWGERIEASLGSQPPVSLRFAGP